MRLRTVMFAAGASVLMGMPALAFAQAMPEDTGLAETEAACSACHPSSQVMSEKRTAEQWTDTVNDMMARGAAVSEANIPIIVAYLAKHFGPVDAAAAGAAPAAPAADAAAPAPAPQ